MKSRANPEKKILINVIFLFLKEQTWCVAGSTPNHRHSADSSTRSGLNGVQAEHSLVCGLVGSV